MSADIGFDFGEGAVRRAFRSALGVLLVSVSGSIPVTMGGDATAASKASVLNGASDAVVSSSGRWIAYVVPAGEAAPAAGVPVGVVHRRDQLLGTDEVVERTDLRVADFLGHGSTLILYSNTQLYEWGSGELRPVGPTFEACAGPRTVLPSPEGRFVAIGTFLPTNTPGTPCRAIDNSEAIGILDVATNSMVTVDVPSQYGGIWSFDGRRIVFQEGQFDVPTMTLVHGTPQPANTSSLALLDPYPTVSRRGVFFVAYDPRRPITPSSPFSPFGAVWDTTSEGVFVLPDLDGTPMVVDYVGGIGVAAANRGDGSPSRYFVIDFRNSAVIPLELPDAVTLRLTGGGRYLAITRLIGTGPSASTSMEIRRLPTPLPAGTVSTALASTTLAAAALVNLTMVDGAAPGYITADRCSNLTAGPQSRSNGNHTTSTAIANLSVVPLDTDGTFCIYNQQPVNLVVDVQGTFVPTGGLGFAPTPPRRVLDTRAD
jgi:hypothetical protein